MCNRVCFAALRTCRWATWKRCLIFQHVTRVNSALVKVKNYRWATADTDIWDLVQHLTLRFWVIWYRQGACNNLFLGKWSLKIQCVCCSCWTCLSSGGRWRIRGGRSVTSPTTCFSFRSRRRNLYVSMTCMSSPVDLIYTCLQFLNFTSWLTGNSICTWTHQKIPSGGGPSLAGAQRLQ